MVMVHLRGTTTKKSKEEDEKKREREREPGHVDSTSLALRWRRHSSAAVEGYRQLTEMTGMRSTRRRLALVNNPPTTRNVHLDFLSRRNGHTPLQKINSPTVDSHWNIQFRRTEITNASDDDVLNGRPGRLNSRRRESVDSKCHETCDWWSLFILAMDWTHTADDSPHDFH